MDGRRYGNMISSSEQWNSRTTYAIRQILQHLPYQIARLKKKQHHTHNSHIHTKRGAYNFHISSLVEIAKRANGTAIVRQTSVSNEVCDVNEDGDVREKERESKRLIAREREMEAARKEREGARKTKGGGAEKNLTGLNLWLCCENVRKRTHLA